MDPADDEIFTPAELESWREARHAEFCIGSGGTPEIRHSKPSAQGSGRYLYRPRQVLVEAVEGQEYTRIENEITGRRGAPAEEVNSHFDEVGLPVRSFTMPDDVDIQDLVTEFRQREDDHARLNIAPNHVFSGEQIYHGGPSGEPRSADKFDEPAMSGSASAPTIAVLDTGYDQAALTLHPELAARLDTNDCAAEDAVLPTGFLAAEGGHGTFIDGIIMRVAPEARIRQVGVLTPTGLTDDQTVALQLARAAQAGIQVINLSLGGYTSHDEPPLAMALTLTHLRQDVAIVAAAGNNSSERPFWPGAFKRVVSVGALDTREKADRDGTKRASFSNHGWWVDVYAPGVRICSTYLDGKWQRPGGTERVFDGYAYWSGTSFAAPQVAAMIASQIAAAGSARHAAGSARQAVLQVLAQARWVAGVGPVLIPQNRVD